MKTTTKGHVVEIGWVIASPHPFADDVVAAKPLGFQVQTVRHLWGPLERWRHRPGAHGLPAPRLDGAVGALPPQLTGND